jgi:hypothetical protein
VFIAVLAAPTSVTLKVIFFQFIGLSASSWRVGPEPSPAERATRAA